VLGALVLAAATRAELIVLIPATLTAVLLTAALDGATGVGSARRVGAAIVQHRLLFGAVGCALLAAGVSALAGTGIYSIFGRYANVGRSPFPSGERLVRMLAWHVAGIDLAVGVVPVVAVVVAAVALARRGFRSPALPFAALAASVTVWLVAEVAYDAAVFDVSDVPRIHERFLIYLVPFFLVTLLATVEIPAREAPRVLYLVGCGVATLLVIAIPFHTVVNQTSAVDTFGLQPLAHTSHGRVVPIPHATLVALAGAALLSLLFLQVRRRLRATIVLMLIPLLLIGGQEMSRISAGSFFARSHLPVRTDWVDAAHPSGSVVLLTGAEDPTAALQTAYANESISRLYYLCRPVAGPEFGERGVTVDATRRLRSANGLIEAAYAVAPAGLGVEGRVVARNRRGREVLLAVDGKPLRLTSARRSAGVGCER
jgi:hypothetical protein